MTTMLRVGSQVSVRLMSIMTACACDVGELGGYVSREMAHWGNFNFSLLFNLLAPNTGGVL